MVNSTAEARRQAAAVKIGSVYDLEYAAKPWFGFAGYEKSSDARERELFLIVTRISRILSHLERSKLPVGLVRSNKMSAPWRLVPPPTPRRSARGRRSWIWIDQGDEGDAYVVSMTPRKRSSIKGHSPTATECAALFLAEQAEPSSPRRGVGEFFRRCGDGRIRAEGEGHS